MADALGVQPPSVKVNGADLSVENMDLLLDLRVSLTVHAAPMAQLRFDDAHFTLLDGSTFVIGAPLAISLPTPTNQIVAVFAGDIVSVGVEQGMGGRHELVVTAYEGTHKLAAQTQQKSYLKQTRGDVVKAIAGRNGLSAKVEGSVGAAEPYLLQTSTDYAFLSELATDLGFEWFVSGKNLHFRPRPSTAGTTLKWGEDLLRFQARYSAADAAVQSVTVRGWDPAKQAAITGDDSVSASPPAHVLGSNAPLASGSHSKAKSSFGKKLVVGSAAVRDAAEAKAVATSIAKDMLGDAMTARGETVGNPSVKPGTMVKVENMGTKLSGSYYVTEVEHVFGVRRPLITRFAVTGHRPSKLSDIARSGGSDDTWGHTGVVIGVVTNNNDPEKIGRVKVKFPTLGDNVESNWARLALPGGGSARGFDVRPEVNDEVIVAFDRGDLRMPIVLGGVWSAKNKPPLDAAKAVKGGKVQQRSFTTRLGHQILLNDGDSPKDHFIELALSDKKTSVHIGEDGIKVVASQGKPVSITNGQATITLTDKGDITMKGTNITIEAQAKVTIKGAQIEAKGSAAMKLEAGATLEAKGAIVKVEASGIASVKGAMLKLN
jgi:phage protein D/phage baseplate assembly protein gpV